MSVESAPLQVPKAAAVPVDRRPHRRRAMWNPFVEHPRSTDAGQGYWAHAAFAATNSLTLVWAGLAGLVHAVFPWWFPFYAAETVIRMFDTMQRSGRHGDSIARILG